MRFLARICPVILLVVLLCSCSGKSAAEKQAVRIAYFPNITHAQALVGKEEGFFEKKLEGVDLVWKEFNAGPAEIEAIMAGEIDIGYIGPGPAINGYTKSNGDMKIIAGASGGGAILVGRSGLNISDVSQLKGKKVAVPQFGNTQDLCLRGILKSNGLKDTAHGGDVEVVQVSNPDVKTLLENGGLDAALVPEPWGSQLVSEANANVILEYDKIGSGGMYATAVVISRTDFIKKHSDIVKKFIEAHVEITDYINSNPDKAKKAINVQIMASTGKSMKEDILNSSFQRLEITCDPMTESLKGFIDLSFEMSFIKEKPEVSKLLDSTLLDGVLRDKGKGLVQ